MAFSERTPRDLSHNRITNALDVLQTGSYIDLTESNPTQCGFNYPADLLKKLNRSEGLVYQSDPLGNLRAREAVASYLASKGQRVEPANIFLTASTSEAYSFIFKLLGNPGDSFLVPAPGYPLLDHLLRLEGLEALPYSLRVESNWPVDLPLPHQNLQTNTKGLIVVNPQNPTGCFLSLSDQKALLDLCRQHQMAYLSDEVFSDFAYPGQGLAKNSSPAVLSFRLGGLSKSLGLPQLKLSWIILDGPKELLGECKERLELIADTYLSVNTPVQLALGDLFKFAPDFQNQGLHRVMDNRAFLEQTLKGVPGVSIWPAQGGWYALVEIQKATLSEERWVLNLLEKHKVLVQPGGFYDFPKGCFLVLSLLPKSTDFEEGVRRIRECLAQTKN